MNSSNMKQLVLLGLVASASAAIKKAAASDDDVNNEPITEMGKKVIWAGFFGLAVPAAYFAMQTFSKPDGADKKYHVYTTGICTIASLAYLTMATGNGIFVRGFDGREFFYARYIDWTLTTPLMLIDILGLAGANADTTNLLIGADILMIIAGLIGAFLEGQEKWYFWAFGMFMFMPILYYLNAYKGPSGTTLSKISLLTIVGWSAYPIVWVAAEGRSMISGDQEAMAYTILDIICKSVFGFLIISARDNSTPASAPVAVPVPAATTPATDAGSML
jgi:bacteriorhodopsin